MPASLQCEHCGRWNADTAWDCAYCGAPLDEPLPRLDRREARRTGGRRTGGRRMELPKRSSPVALTLALTLGLAVAGVGGVRAAALLEHAMRPQAASDLAAVVCDALKARDYHLLTSEIDPSPDPTSAKGVLDPKTAASALQALDSSQGSVTSCKYQQLSLAPGSSHGAVANFSLTLQRQKQSGSQGILLILTQKADGSWKIARSSNLVAGS